MTDQSQVKRIYKSRTDRMIDGVCGGIAEYFNVDPTLVRVATVLLALSGGMGIVLYFAGMIIMPANPTMTTGAIAVKSSATNHRFWGILLVVFGILLFMGNMGWDFWHHWWWFSWSTTVPVLLILAGVAFLFGGRNYISPATGTETAGPIVSGSVQAEVRRLYRSRGEKKLFGVCGGLGDYFNIDPVIVRILFILGAFASFGIVLLLYVIMAIVVPSGSPAKSA
jgi:phage shock protein C